MELSKLAGQTGVILFSNSFCNINLKCYKGAFEIYLKELEMGSEET